MRTRQRTYAFAERLVPILAAPLVLLAVFGAVYVARVATALMAYEPPELERSRPYEVIYREGLWIGNACPDGPDAIQEASEWLPAWYLHVYAESLRERTAEWFGERLVSLEEPTLRCEGGDEQARVYRFTIMRSFDSDWVVRIERRGQDARLIAKESKPDHWTRREHGAARVVERDLSLSEWRQFEDAIAESGFWSMPSTTAYRGNDGASWWFEGVEWGVYHVARRWSPRPGPARDLGRHFMELAGATQALRGY